MFIYSMLLYAKTMTSGRPTTGWLGLSSPRQYDTRRVAGTHS